MQFEKLEASGQQQQCPRTALVGKVFAAKPEQDIFVAEALSVLGPPLWVISMSLHSGLSSAVFHGHE